MSEKVEAEAKTKKESRDSELEKRPKEVTLLSKERDELLSDGMSIITSHSQAAVVRGALMIGLTSTSPEFATVKISARSARKHYETPKSLIIDHKSHCANITPLQLTSHASFPNSKPLIIGAQSL